MKELYNTCDALITYVPSWVYSYGSGKSINYRRLQLMEFKEHGDRRRFHTDISFQLVVTMMMYNKKLKLK